MEFKAGLVFLGVVIAASGCTSSQTDAVQQTSEQTPPNTQTNRPSPVQVTENYIESFRRGDMESAYSYLSSNLKAEERTERLDDQSLMTATRQRDSGERSIEVQNVEEVSTSEGTATVNVVIDSYVLDRYSGTLDTNLTLVKEEERWRLNRSINPYSSYSGEDGTNILGAQQESSSGEFESPGTAVN